MNARIKYYETYIEKKYKTNVQKLKKKCKLNSKCLDIEQIFTENQKEMNFVSSADLKNKLLEYKAFYSGDTTRMDSFQRKLKEKVMNAVSFLEISSLARLGNGNCTSKS